MLAAGGALAWAAGASRGVAGGGAGAGLALAGLGALSLRSYTGAGRTHMPAIAGSLVASTALAAGMGASWYLGPARGEHAAAIFFTLGCALALFFLRCLLFQKSPVQAGARAEAKVK